MSKDELKVTTLALFQMIVGVAGIALILLFVFLGVDLMNNKNNLALIIVLGCFGTMAIVLGVLAVKEILTDLGVL